ncbi:MAG: DUF4175 family protein [Candidatus Cloacimonadales bacterium]
MRKFTEKIKEQQYKLNIIISLKYLLMIVAILLLTFNLFLAVYFMTEGYSGEKFLFALSLKITLALTALYVAMKLNRELLSRQQAARILDKRNQDITDSYQTARDLLLEQGEAENPILQEIYRTADDLAQQQRVKYDFSLLRRLATLVGIVLVGNLILAFTASSAWQEAAEFFALRSLPQVQHKEYIELQPGNATLLRGSSLQVELIDPEQNLQHDIFYRQHQVWRQDQMVQGSYSFSNLENSTEYFVENEFVRSDTFYLEVLEIPALKQIVAKIDFPAYTNLPTRQDSSGNISLLEGSTLHLKIKANNPLETAQLVWDEQIFEMQRLGKSTFSQQLKPQISGNYYFNLTDILGNQSQKILYQIQLQSDELPQVEILQPAADTVLSQNMLLPLVYTAADDFALQDLELHYYKNSEAAQQRILQKKIGRTILKDDYIFDLRQLNLFPGDRVSFWLEVTDNKPEAQRGKSAVRQVRLPSIEEIYDEVAAEESAQKEQMDDTLQRSEELEERLEEKRRELMKRDELDWEDKKELEKFLQEQNELSDSVDKLAENYRQMLEKLEQNQALSSEMMEKMERISELMQEISNEELRETMEKMQKSLEKMEPEDVKQALDEMKFSMQEFSEKLEQTLQMLEDIKQEQALQKASDIAQEMQQMQEELNKKTAEESESSEALAEKQQAIEEKAAALQEQMEKASDLMQSESAAEMQEQMQEMLQQMEELSEELREAAENLQSEQKAEAMENQQKASEMMQQMNQQLSEMSQEMNTMGMQINAESLDLALQRLLIWSAEHEKLQQRFQQDPYLILPDLIANQEGMNLTLQELYATPMIFLLLGPKFMYDANQTIQSYQKLFQHINEANRNKVDDYLLEIQQGLNLMVYDLILAKSNMQDSSGGGGGMQSLMQQMQQMGEQQMMLNMLTSQMLKEFGESGKMSHEMRQELGKLAADEQRLADNLQRAIQSDPAAQKQAQSLNRIAEELESISRDLQRGRINSDIIKSQERILSRLLSAQKSIHQREFSKQRKAESSEVQDWDTPEAVQQKFEKMRRRALLQEEYKNYAPQYQELIREYLKKINEE